jgi:hypothetical protein
MSFDYKKFKNSIIKQYTNILDEVIITHVTQKPKKVSETAIPSEIAAKP